MAKIHAFFRLMNSQDASDLHMISGNPPCLRIQGEIEPVKYHELTSDELMEMLAEITPEYKIREFEETGDVDFAYDLPGVSRYRVNYFLMNMSYIMRSLTFRQVGMAKPLLPLTGPFNNALNIPSCISWQPRHMAWPARLTRLRAQ